MNLLRCLLRRSLGLGFRLCFCLWLGLSFGFWFGFGFRLRFGFGLLAGSRLLFRFLLNFRLLFLGILSIGDRFLKHDVSRFTHGTTEMHILWSYENEKPWVFRQVPRQHLQWPRKNGLVLGILGENGKCGVPWPSFLLPSWVSLPLQHRLQPLSSSWGRASSVSPLLPHHHPPSWQ